MIHLNKFMKDNDVTIIQGFRFWKWSNARYSDLLKPVYSSLVLILRMFSWMKILHDCRNGSILECLPLCVMTVTQKMIAETDVYFELLPFESSLLEIIMLFV